MNFLEIDAEMADHLDFALLHLRFARDFMWRTGLKKELYDEGWAYGHDYNGTGELERSQFDTITKLLMPGITTDVEELSLTESEELREMTFDFDVENPPPFFDDYIYVAEFLGPEEEMKAWSSFFKMFLPESHIGYWQDAHWGQGQTPRSHFLWLLSHEQFVYMEAFTAMVSAWEVKIYYDHIADQCAWRTLRGSVNTCPQSEPITKA